jgi:hypothetical protein
MIRVDRNDNDHFTVTVSKGGSETTHQVELDDKYHNKLTGPGEPKEELIRRSFEFLLRREPKESILGSFHLSKIAIYFPEYEQDIRER